MKSDRLVQFDTGMIACMFVCWVCVCVWIFLAAVSKHVSSEYVFISAIYPWMSVSNGSLAEDPLKKTNMLLF